MQVKCAAVIAAIATALFAPAGPAQAMGDNISGVSVKPVMKYAGASVYACRGRSEDFSTATFTMVNRGETQAFANAWADRGYRAEIGSQRLRGGERAELGEFGTTGSTVRIQFHVVIRVDGQARTKTLLGGDLQRC